MTQKKLNFLADFPAISTQEWMDKITVDLKGADFTKKLVWRTPEGFNVQPFYRAEDLEGLKTPQSAPGEFPYVRGTKQTNSWYIRQDMKTKDAKEQNTIALDILNKGVDSLGLKLDKTKLNAEYIETLLNDIYANIIELNFKVCVRKNPEAIRLITDYFKAKKYDLSQLKGSFNCDPINRMLVKGKNISAAEIAKVLQAVVEAGKELPQYKTVAVNAISLNNAGVYCSQELGYALAWGNQYLEMLTDAGVDIDTAAKAIKFNFGVSGNYFMEIAKFRAARLLWSKIVEAYGPKDLASAKMAIHAETSSYNLTIFDAHVNLLRTQTEAMSAALGGVDSLTVVPFDKAYETPDEFSERIARNQQLLMKEESHFDKVIDPAAGSYYLENLTAMIADQAWKLFLDIQEKGGFYQAVENGTIQAQVKENFDKRAKALASRKEVLLGTNQFPNFNEKAADKVQSKECKAHKCCCGAEEGELAKLPNGREAEEFEALRFATEKAAKTPKAFMLTIGNLAMRLARAQFSCNFFACAGYEVIDNLGFETVEEGVAAAQKAGADIIVLCSSDDEYADYAIPTFKAINGKQIFVVAGAPACMEDLQKAGIENFVHVRVNVLETLQKFNQELGIK